ncbi:eCIS core domain-containing protein, partial [Nostoc edaphicum]
MREHISRQKKTTTGFSIPSLKQPIRGFGLESSAISRQAVSEIQPFHKPLTHDISRIPLRTQAKLSISQPGDKYEQEADSVAQQVMQRMAQPVNRQSIQREALPESEELQMKPLANSITPLVQRQEVPEDEEELQMKSLDNSTLQRQEVPEDEEELQMKSLDNSTLQRQEVPEDEEELQMKSLDNRTLQRQEVPEDEEELQMKPMVQRQAKAGMAGAPDLEASINQARGGGVAIADNIREPMEVAFGADFSGVKVHTDGQSDQLNRSIQARAFTTGQDVFFRQGEYNPGSRSGQELLAHELTHVVQQKGGVLDTANVQRVWGSGLPASVKAPATEDQKAKAKAEEQEKKKAQEQEKHQQEVQSFIKKIEDFILTSDGTADGTKTGRWNYYPTFKISQKICDDAIKAWKGKGSGQNYHVLESHKNNEGYINFLRTDPKKSSSTKSV